MREVVKVLKIDYAEKVIYTIVRDRKVPAKAQPRPKTAQSLPKAA